MEDKRSPPPLSTQPCIMYIQAHTYTDTTYTHSLPLLFFLLISLYQAAVVWWVRWGVLGKRVKWICMCCSSSGINFSPKKGLSLCVLVQQKEVVCFGVCPVRHAL